MTEAVVLYYSSNQEDPKFENRIVESLLKNSNGLPIVSVTQKPMNLGDNICVGEVGASGFNMCRQILIGCLASEAKYVISAEADCLYPPEYFTFRPTRDDVCYRNTNLYVMGYNRDYFFHKKEGSTLAQIINRGYYIERLKFLFRDAPMWSTEEKSFPKERGHRFFDSHQFEYFYTENPIISFKSGQGMRRYTHSDRTPVFSLPHWGDSKRLRELYL